MDTFKIKISDNCITAADIHVLICFNLICFSLLEKCVKVGEGTYGEVYKTSNGNEDVALKVFLIIHLVL